MTEQDVINILRGKITADCNRTQLAEKIDCSRGHLSRVINGGEAPGHKILAYLGLRKVVSVEYEPAPKK